MPPRPCCAARTPTGSPPPRSRTTAATAGSNDAPSASPRPTTACSPALCRPSGYAATPEAWTASGPARKSCTGSPVCPPTWPAPRSSTTTNDGTGSWKIVCIGSATSPSARTHPSCAPAPHPEHSRPSATWRSAPCAWPDAPTSPTPAATCTTTTTPSPHSESETVRPSQIGHLATTPGPWVYDWALIDSADPDHQYMIRRSIDDGELAFYHCYNPNHAGFGELVHVAGARWPIEECFGSTKNEVGLDHYQVRTWDAWHRHITLAMLAHTFLEVIASKAKKAAASVKGGASRP